MGLLTILKKMKQKEKEVRILMLYVSYADTVRHATQFPPGYVVCHKQSPGRIHCEKVREISSPEKGLDNAGKTTIVKKFNGEDITTISPTLGFSIKTLEHRGFKLNIWDVGGQKSLRSYWRNYFESTDGLIWVVDCADKRRLQDCKQELEGLLVEERLAGATLLVFANKQDLPGALSSDAIKEALDLDNLKTHHWLVIGCSAVTGENLLTGVDWLIDDIASRIFTID